MVTAKNLMENKFYTINRNEPITKALSLFEKTDALVVTAKMEITYVAEKKEEKS